MIDIDWPRKSYFLNRDTFHVAQADFSAGPCVTRLTCGEILKDSAKVLSLPGYEAAKPKQLSHSKLWEVIEDCIRG